MALESNIFQWIGGSIDITLNSLIRGHLPAGLERTAHHPVFDLSVP
jgi:hypothetical protein